MELVREQIQALEKERKELLKNSSDPAIKQVQCLLPLKGIGMNSAWVDVMELFALWRYVEECRLPAGTQLKPV